MNIYKTMKKRRSIYSLSKKSVVSDEKILEIVEFAAKYTPSAFHSQSQRICLLLGEKHNKLWDITMETLRKIVPADKFSGTEKKILSFQAGYGTVLYFDDEIVTRSLQENNPLYKDNFPVWAEQSNGMLQFALWSLLEAEGFGASLQHYNPLIDNEVKTCFEIPDSWRLMAQMPFGKIEAMPDEKIFADMKTRVKICK